ncbi:hypothetical protein [Cerasicoccus fimbriatus]|uniref:hypothetical protein n=1 Tax=Cerasicoccus fimbriatus TaxID=3014554 RepID=UPI0022B315D5|nr:hypothetical protein [Cerasicoccus sp. TK19100]
MSLITAVKREIASRSAGDTVRLTLEYMMNHALGRRNAVPISVIVEYLNENGINITYNQFQQTVLSESRGSDFFIATCNRGCFLIDTIDDAREGKSFFEEKIAKQQAHLDNLVQVAQNVGWTI